MLKAKVALMRQKQHLIGTNKYLRKYVAKKVSEFL